MARVLILWYDFLAEPALDMLSTNRATTSFTLAGHSADFTLASFLWSPPVVGTSQPWRRQTMIWARSLIQPVVF